MEASSASSSIETSAALSPYEILLREYWVSKLTLLDAVIQTFFVKDTPGMIYNDEYSLMTSVKRSNYDYFLVREFSEMSAERVFSIALLAQLAKKTFLVCHQKTSKEIFWSEEVIQSCYKNTYNGDEHRNIFKNLLIIGLDLVCSGDIPSEARKVVDAMVHFNNIAHAEKARAERGAQAAQENSSSSLG